MTYIPKAFCSSCKQEMVCVAVGILIETRTAVDGNYYKISSDLYQCPLCYKGFFSPAEAPLAFSHEDSYEKFFSSATVYFTRTKEQRDASTSESSPDLQDARGGADLRPRGRSSPPSSRDVVPSSRDSAGRSGEAESET